MQLKNIPSYVTDIEIFRDTGSGSVKFTNLLVDSQTGTASMIVGKNGTYKAVSRQTIDNVEYLFIETAPLTVDSIVDPTAEDAEEEPSGPPGISTLVFHHGNFDNAHGDGDVATALANGNVYADSPFSNFTQGTLSAVTTSNETTYTWTPDQDYLADALVVAGGGGGGGDIGGGGGAGGYLESPGLLVSGAQTIVVGRGGYGRRYDGYEHGGSKGKNSSFGTMDAEGGGMAGAGHSASYAAGSGGSGGGSNSANGHPGPANGVSGQGHRGGDGYHHWWSGGGGGAGGLGKGGNGVRGNGGDGKAFEIRGTEYWFAGGGGASGHSSEPGGNGGKGGGGGGSTYQGSGNEGIGDTSSFVNANNGEPGGERHGGSAAPHSGGGGGGGTHYATNGGNGGSGIVVLRTPGGGAAGTGDGAADGVQIREWPPVSGNISSLSTGGASAGATDTWSIEGAAYGNGQYTSTSSLDMLHYNSTSFAAFDKTNSNNTFTTAGDTHSGAYHSTGFNGGIITIQLPEAVAISSYAIWDRSQTSEYILDPTDGNNYDSTSSHIPKSWTIEGSNDGTNWTVVDTRVDASTAKIAKHEYSFENTDKYSYYRINVSSTHTGQYLIIGEWQLFEKVEPPRAFELSYDETTAQLVVEDVPSAALGEFVPDEYKLFRDGNLLSVINVSTDPTRITIGKAGVYHLEARKTIDGTEYLLIETPKLLVTSVEPTGATGTSSGPLLSTTTNTDSAGSTSNVSTATPAEGTDYIYLTQENEPRFASHTTAGYSGLKFSSDIATVYVKFTTSSSMSSGGLFHTSNFDGNDTSPKMENWWDNNSKTFHLWITSSSGAHTVTQIYYDLQPNTEYEWFFQMDCASGYYNVIVNGEPVPVHQYNGSGPYYYMSAIGGTKITSNGHDTTGTFKNVTLSTLTFPRVGYGPGGSSDPWTVQAFGMFNGITTVFDPYPLITLTPNDTANLVPPDETVTGNMERTTGSYTNIPGGLTGYDVKYTFTDGKTFEFYGKNSQEYGQGGTPAYWSQYGISNIFDGSPALSVPSHTTQEQAWHHNNNDTNYDIVFKYSETTNIDVFDIFGSNAGGTFTQNTASNSDAFFTIQLWTWNGTAWTEVIPKKGLNCRAWNRIEIPGTSAVDGWCRIQATGKSNTSGCFAIGEVIMSAYDIPPEPSAMTFDGTNVISITNIPSGTTNVALFRNDVLWENKTVSGTSASFNILADGIYTAQLKNGEFLVSELPELLNVPYMSFEQTVTKNNDGTYDVSVTIPAMEYTSVSIMSLGIAQVTANNIDTTNSLTIEKTGLGVIPYSLRFVKDEVEYETGGLTKVLTQEGYMLSAQVTGVTQSTLFFTPTGTTTEQSQYIGTSTSVQVSQTGTYRMEFITDTGFEFTNEISFESFPGLSAPLAFHHGNFDDAYADGSVAAAASNGHVYADTAPGTYSWGTLDSAPTSTATGTTYKWTPSKALAASVLVVAGGGAGAYRAANSGGGGAGGFISEQISISSSQQTIVVGNGGIKSTTSGTMGSNGANSTAFGFSAIGGGGGAYYGKDGLAGGSGGGGGQDGGEGGTSGGAGTDGQGNAGGNVQSAYYGGAGGGGADTAGVGGTAQALGGNGGDGKLWEPTGEYYAGGGGGSNHHQATTQAGFGGKGGGGDGSHKTTFDATDGEMHKGAGGGGGGEGKAAGSGGSGIVIIAPPSSDASNSSVPELTFDGNKTLSVKNVPNNSSGTLVHTKDGITTTANIGTTTEIIISKTGDYSVFFIVDGTHVGTTGVVNVSAVVAAPQQPTIVQTIELESGEWSSNHLAYIGTDGTKYRYRLHNGTSFFTDPQGEIAYDYSTSTWVDHGTAQPHLVETDGNTVYMHWNSSADYTSYQGAFTDPYVGWESTSLAFDGANKLTIENAPPSPYTYEVKVAHTSGIGEVLSQYDKQSFINGINSASVPLTADMVTWNDDLSKGGWVGSSTTNDIVGLSLPLKDSMVESKARSYPFENPVAVGDLLFTIQTSTRMTDLAIGAFKAYYHNGYAIYENGVLVAQDSSNGGTSEYNNASSSNGSILSWEDAPDNKTISITLMHTKNGVTTKANIGTATEIIINDTGDYSVALETPSVYIAGTNVVTVSAVGTPVLPNVYEFYVTAKANASSGQIISYGFDSTPSGVTDGDIYEKSSIVNDSDFEGFIAGNNGSGAAGMNGKPGVGDKLFEIRTTSDLTNFIIYWYRSQHQPGVRVVKNGVEVYTESASGASGGTSVVSAEYTFDTTIDAPPIPLSLAFDGANKLTIQNAPSGLTRVTLNHTKDGVTTRSNIGTATEILVTEGGDYSVSVETSSVYVMSTNVVTVGSVSDPVSLAAPLVFHYGNFDDAYADGSVATAAANGRVYADTPTGSYSWGTLVQHHIHPQTQHTHGHHMNLSPQMC